MTVNEKIAEIKRKLSPYTDIILFVVCLFAANAIWKLCISGDEMLGTVMLLGIDITQPYAWIAEHTARISAWWLELLRDTAHYRPPFSIRFDSGFAVRIVWSCTPIKQAFIWLVIMLFARGSWIRKTWFIPLGWVCIHVFNIFRIVVIALLCEYHSDMFPFWHEHVFKYVFYGMLFLLWVLWAERIGRKTPAS